MNSTSFLTSLTIPPVYLSRVNKKNHCPVENVNYSELHTCTIPTLTKPLPKVTTPKHHVFHYIRTNGPPCHSLPLEKIKVARAEFEHMLHLGIIRRSEEYSWAPFQARSETSWRLEIFELQMQIPLLIGTNYHISRTVSLLHSKTIFSTNDLVKAYHQIGVAPEDIPQIAITTPFGLLELLCMPSGLRNAA